MSVILWSLAFWRWPLVGGLSHCGQSLDKMMTSIWKGHLWYLLTSDSAELWLHTHLTWPSSGTSLNISSALFHFLLCSFLASNILSSTMSLWLPKQITFGGKAVVLKFMFLYSVMVNQQWPLGNTRRNSVVSSFLFNLFLTDSSVSTEQSLAVLSWQNCGVIRKTTTQQT